MRKYLLFLLLAGISNFAIAQVQLTNLPSLYFTTENNAPVNSKETYTKGSLKIMGGTHDEGYYDGEIEIRGRGNSTWGMAKKPYRVRLKNKYQMLGLPAKERNWVLLANYADKSLLRNALAFEISKFMGFGFTPAYKFVDVFINDEYQGNYMLTDHMEVKPKRVEVEEQSPDNTTEPDITGGYLLEVDGWADQEPVWFATTRNTKVTIKFPSDDDINTQQRNYIANYVQTFENMLFSESYQDSINSYRQYVDIKSMVDYYILSELTSNPDCFWSTYMYKRFNDPKLYTGPVWDFDIAFNNDRRLGDISYKYMLDYAYTNRWHTRLLSDPYFFQQVRSRWEELKTTGLLQKLEQVSDSLVNILDASQQENYQRWPTLNQIVYNELAARGSYANEVKFVKDFVSNRFEWLNLQWQGLDTGKYFNIINSVSLKYLDVIQNNQDDIQTIQKDSSGTYAQLWKFVNLNNGYYQLVQHSSNKVLYDGGTNTSGSILTLDSSDLSNERQQWRIIYMGDKFSITNKITKNAVGLNSSSTAENAPVVQLNNNSYTDPLQQWQLLISPNQPQPEEEPEEEPEPEEENPGENPGENEQPGEGENPDGENPGENEQPGEGENPEEENPDNNTPTITKLYPNPVIKQWNIVLEFNTTVAEQTQIMIYSKDGKRVRQINKGIVPVGNQRFLIPVGDLSPGLYFIKLISKSQSFTRKIYVLK